MYGQRARLGQPDLIPSETGRRTRAAPAEAETRNTPVRVHRMESECPVFALVAPFAVDVDLHTGENEEW